MGIKIALAGNPNCGKTTMFNALTGANQYVGNWPGVTVEKKEGKLKGKRKNDDIIVTDLPGIYSLSPYTLEEVVSRDYILNDDPDVIIDLVDATNIERNLYLTTQLIETGVPVVVALNMTDLLEKRGIKIDTKRLSMLLDCPIVETSALKQTGLDTLIETAIKVANKKEVDLPREIFSKEMEAAVADVKGVLPDTISEDKKRWYAVKFLENDSKVVESMNLSAAAKAAVDKDRKELETKHDDDMESIVTDERYKFIQKIVETTVKKGKDKLTTSDKIDRIVTNRILGIPIFIAVMFVVYYISVTTIGTIVTDWTNDTFVVAIQDIASKGLEAAGVSSVIEGLVVDGIIGGIGAPVGFAPQMAIVFFFLSILEDCGYMARVAFIMDRVFRRFGLSGKSFIPMLVSSGCGVPGVMATKTIENEKDRRMTVMTTTFIPCGAKLPIIALLMGSIIGDSSTTAAWISPLFYFLGVFAVIASGLMLKKTKLFAGRPTPFVMELPAYHFPAIRSWALHVWERCWAFIKKAGTVIFASTVVVWFLSNFGSYNGSFGFLPAMDGIPEEFMDYSVLAMLGNLVAWIFAPLGFSTWQATALTVSGLVAKENVVATAGSLLSVADAAETDPSLWTAFAGMFPTMGACVAFGAFNLLCAPCFAAMGTIRNQMDSGKWTAIAIGYECAFAWVIGLFINQFYNLLVLGQFGFWTVVAIVLLVAMLFQIFRPMPKHAWTDEDETNTASAAVSA